ncbi:MAG: MoxR family ATPase [Gammaproteobacteria bacterium]|nr:MoxR family ATPase [Gammaproteobacteria bacterium]
MTNDKFDLVPPEGKTPAADTSRLAERPYSVNERSLEKDAPNFIAGAALADAINTGIAVGEPLLLTGEPGTGKTQAAYYTAYQLGVKCIHFQVKSDSTARDLLYDFDMVRYFRDAHLHNLAQREESGGKEELSKGRYIDKRALWQAFELAKEKGVPQVLLIDEIDKAPRDFPNDLLHELDQMEFTIVETEDKIIAPPRLRPIVFITSNSERRLPEPFLRRCVYHHIEFDDRIVEQAVKSRRNEFKNLSDGFLKLAVKRFLALRDRNLRKAPATGELLVWLRVLALATGKYPQQLEEDLAKLPCLGVLLKDHQDIVELGNG